jgi:hypothetical protein
MDRMSDGRYAEDFSFTGIPTSIWPFNDGLFL